jgi:hypothetical protein
MSNADWLSLLVFAAFAFFGILLPWLGRRQGKWQRNLPRRDDAARPAPDELPEDAFDDELLDEAGDEPPVVWSPPPRPAAPVPVPMPAPSVARELPQPRAARPDARPVARPLPSSPRAALIGNLDDARRSIRLMTVLGPCRAFDPY